jgi:inositol oxygenase
MSKWENVLVDEDSKPGLLQLFGSRQARRHQGGVSNFLYENQAHPRNHERFLHEQHNGFFTFRLEHREGGPMAQHRGEERILLFRSDRAGAIAKIIYSSTPAPTNNRALDKNNVDEEYELALMTQAKIHVLDVKEPYRGMDLGGLLFSQALCSLRHRYMTDVEKRDGQQETSDASQYASSIRCQLDAEEDVRRHNKLVHFYENLGCQTKPRAKIQYLNNNDGETYRRIPMQMALRSLSNKESGSHTQHCRRRKFLAADGSLVDRRGCFLPIQLLDISGSTIHVHNQSGGRQDWLIVDDGEGNIQFRTTHGLYLRADPDGQCWAAGVSDDEDADSDTPPEEWANFRLYRVSDALQEYSADEMESEPGHDVRQKELWMLKTVHETFLAVIPENDVHVMYCSKAPTFWQADDDMFSLICTSDTPRRRQHYQKTWIKQTVGYVQEMHQRYLGFQLAKMSIKDALNLIKRIPCHTFGVAKSRTDPGPSLRTLCFKTAEAARDAGHPDWVQLVALVHELGAVVNFIDMNTAVESEDDYDWTITCRSRIVGCKAPDRVNFNEFRALNADESDTRYNSSLGMYYHGCGLDKVLLAWTGPEYMYHMLKHNESLIPQEGLAMLRLFSLGDWHSHDEYKQLTNADDAVVQPLVAEFDQLRRETRRRCNSIDEMTDEQCDKLWDDHYGSIVAKYCGDEDLSW